MATPSPVFPAAIATDVQLKVANNLIQTTLRVNIDGSNTILFVASTAGFTANCLVSIDKEIVAIDTVVSGPNPSLIVASGGRGFDGTSATTHAAGAKVSMFIDAWHHNALSAEVKAIEQFIGPNGQNIGVGYTVYLVSKAYDFAPQSPGGALSIGNNTITLAPVPKGVNGSDANHYLYISGGTGTAEPVLISGGTAVSGAVSGTVIVSCANAHSGAWTIKSATAGIQEALGITSGGRMMVVIPPGTSNIYATITTPASVGFSLVGVGRDVSILSTSYTAGPIISMPNPTYACVAQFSIKGPGGAGSNYAISLVSGWETIVEAVNIINVANGISLTGSLELNVIRDVDVRLSGSGSGGIGFYGNASTGEIATFDRVFVEGNNQPNSTAFKITNGVGVYVHRSYVNGTQDGFVANPGSGQKVGVVDLSGLYVDGYQTNSYQGFGFHLTPAAGGVVDMVRATDCSASGFKYGLLVDGAGTNTDHIYTTFAATGNTGPGIFLVGVNGPIKNMMFVDALVEANGSNTNSGFVANTITNLQIYGGIYAAGSYAAGQAAANSQTYGIVLSTVTNAILNGPVLTPNVTGPITITGSTGVIIKDALGYNPRGLAAVTPTASPFTYTSGYSAETVYISGGTVSNVTRGGNVIATATVAGQSIIIPLPANTSIVVTYTAAPTMLRDGQ
jgi:hypothetical protein